MILNSVVLSVLFVYIKNQLNSSHPLHISVSDLFRYPSRYSLGQHVSTAAREMSYIPLPEVLYPKSCSYLELSAV